MPVSDFNDLCPQTIVWVPMSGRDNFGKPIYGTPQTFAGRRVFKNTRVKAYERGTKGQGPEMVSESQIWILGLPDVKYEDKVYVFGDVKVPPILSIGKWPDENSDFYTKVWLGSANG